MHGLDWYDYGARNYESVLSRFTTMDPLAEKYYSISPYAYCAGNPVMFVDYNGDSISIAGLQNLDKSLGSNFVEQLTNDLQAQTGLTISITSEGQLDYDKDKNSNPLITAVDNESGDKSQTGSATARKLLIKAIDHKDLVEVVPGRTGVPVGSNQIRLSIRQINSFVYGTVGLDSRTLGWGMTFFHELLHTQVGGGLKDFPGNPGPVVSKMNTIRSELGPDYGLRLDYFATPIRGKNYIPFNRNAKESIIIGLPPSLVRPNQQYIKF